MDRDQSAELRISDADRDTAMRALGEHMTAGRLDAIEYDERLTTLTSAKTRGEVLEVFDDLPEPRPRFSNASSPGAAVAESAASHPTRRSWADRPLHQRVAAAAVPVVWVAAIVLTVATHNGLWLLGPIAYTAACRGLWGKKWDKERREIDADPKDQKPHTKRAIENEK